MLKILIVEDNVVFAKQLAKDLQKNNCEVVGIARNATDAIKLFTTEEPNFAFIDIDLEDGDNGITVAEFINKNCRIPFIYLTDNFGASNKHFKKATATLPANYLPKGTFLPNQIWHFVETALYNYSKAGGFYINDDEPNVFLRNQFFVKNKGLWEKIKIDDIAYIIVIKPYCEIHLSNNKKYLVRKALDYTLNQFNNVSFIRIHQSHAVNINFSEKYNPQKNCIVLHNKIELEVGRTYKKELKEKIIFMD